MSSRSGAGAAARRHSGEYASGAEGEGEYSRQMFPPTNAKAQTLLPQPEKAVGLSAAQRLAVRQRLVLLL